MHEAPPTISNQDHTVNNNDMNDNDTDASELNRDGPVADGEGDDADNNGTSQQRQVCSGSLIGSNAVHSNSMHPKVYSSSQEPAFCSSSKHLPTRVYCDSWVEGRES